MIETPFRFEPEMSDQDFQKLGQLSLRWSHIEHIVGNCLKVMLRLSDDEAVVIVFPLSLDQRLNRMSELAEITPLKQDAKEKLDELKAVMKGVQYVRNSVIHSIVSPHDKDGHVFHLRSKMRNLTKAEVFSTEELTNYAGHVVIGLRYALGVKDNQHSKYVVPDRPEIPKFLKAVMQFPQAS